MPACASPRAPSIIHSRRATPLTLLQDMGVIAELKEAGEVHFADNGGFVSPSGLSYIGAHA